MSVTTLNGTREAKVLKPSSLSVLPGKEKLLVPEPSFKWGTRVALPVGILLAFVGLFAGSLASSLTPAIDVVAIPVVERPALTKTVSQTESTSGSTVAQAAGWIEPDPFLVYATALTNGTVEEVLFLEGDAVAKDDVLARLIDDDARLALRRAQSEAQAAEETWEANIEAKRNASITLATVRETEASLTLAQADLDVEKALLKEAQRIFERRKGLVAEGSISEEEFDTAEAAANAQAARVRVVEQRIEELRARLDRVRAEQEAAQRHLELRTEERRRLELAQVALDEARLRVERLEIHSPIDGVIMRRLVEPGSVVMSGSDNPKMSQVAELYDPAHLQVRVDVPLADASKVGVGQSAEIVVEILPERVFAGKVSRITNLADIQKNTLEVKVAIEDPAPELKPDMLARVRFLARQTTSDSSRAPMGLSVFAHESGISENTAWVVSKFDGEEGHAAKRTITLTGAQNNDWLEIADGLQPGDYLIVSSDSTLNDGDRVRVRQERGE